MPPTSLPPFPSAMAQAAWTRPRSTGNWWERFRGQRAAVAALAVLAAFTLAALLADVIAPGDPGRSTGAALQAPSAAHWFGTDDLGRDVFARAVHGSRPTLVVGLLAALTSGAIGAAVGGIAGYFGGAADDLAMRVTEAVQVMPRFFLVPLVAALFGPSIVVTTGLLGLTLWPAPARVVRSQVLSLRTRPFVLAARALGASEWRVLALHVLPQVLPLAVAHATLQVGAAILTEAGLSFLGLGDRTAVSWGGLLNDAQPLFRFAWWTALPPGVCVTATVLAVNLVGDSLSMALDPRRRNE